VQLLCPFPIWLHLQLPPRTNPSLYPAIKRYRWYPQAELAMERVPWVVRRLQQEAKRTTRPQPLVPWGGWWRHWWWSLGPSCSRVSSCGPAGEACGAHCGPRRRRVGGAPVPELPWQRPAAAGGVQSEGGQISLLHCVFLPLVAFAASK
jgi:hypothetical protein